MVKAVALCNNLIKQLLMSAILYCIEIFSLHFYIKLLTNIPYWQNRSMCRCVPREAKLFHCSGKEQKTS